MLVSGDWVTARLDGIPYLEKPPLIYWTIALSYKIFGVHDWSARIPIVLSVLALCWVTAAFGVWAFGKRAGFYAGLCVGTCVGLFLFTRILIPDVTLTFTTALAMWAFLRAIDEEEPHPRFWAFLFAANLGAGLLLKSLIAVVFPVGAAIVYLLLTRQLFSWKIWKRPPSHQRSARYSADRRSLAHHRHAAQPALFCFYPAQRPQFLPRLLVVFLHQRAAASLPESSLPARLQHRPAPLLLALSSDLAVSLERLPPGRLQTFLQTN